MRATQHRQFRGPWPQAYARMLLYLLEMLAAGAEPAAVHLHLAKALASPEDIGRDLPALRDALSRRLGAGRVSCAVADGADSHEIRLEWAPAATVKVL